MYCLYRLLLSTITNIKMLEASVGCTNMKYTGFEMSAIVKLAIAMIAADGKVEESEKTALSMELLKFGVKPDSLQTILATAQALDYGYAIAIVAAMDVEQKKYVTGFLAFIMASDGEIADSEIETWRLISTLAQLPPMTVSEALVFWNNH